MFMQIVQTPPSRGVQIINNDHLSYIDDTDPIQAINTSMMQTPPISGLRFHLSNIVVHVSYQLCAKTCESIEDYTTTVRFV